MIIFGTPFLDFFLPFRTTQRSGKGPLRVPMKTDAKLTLDIQEEVCTIMKRENSKEDEQCKGRESQSGGEIMDKSSQLSHCQLSVSFGEVSSWVKLLRNITSSTSPKSENPWPERVSIPHRQCKMVVLHSIDFGIALKRGQYIYSRFNIIRVLVP